MQFGRSFPHILQAIWESDPAKFLIRVSKIDVTDAYHHSTLWTSHMGAFAYIIPSAPDKNCIIIFINMVLSMGWVDSPKLFCDFSETLADFTNALVYMDLLILAYGAISKIPSTGPDLPQHTR